MDHEVGVSKMGSVDAYAENQKAFFGRDVQDAKAKGLNPEIRF